MKTVHAFADEHLPAGIKILPNRALEAHGETIGILNPATLVRLRSRDVLEVIGPRGRVIAGRRSGKDIVAALIATGALLSGNPDDTETIATLLEDASLSRTVSYLCSSVADCRAVIEAVKRIRGARITVVGCGGIGGLAAVLLAGTGVGRLHLIDGDVVEASNLNRQLMWCRKDIGALKVDVLLQRIRERFPTVSVTSQAMRFSYRRFGSDLDDSDVVLVTGDNPPNLAEQIARKARRFCLISAGYSFTVAVLTVWPPEPLQRRPTPRCYTIREAIMPSFGPMNAELAGLTASVAIRRLVEGESRGGHIIVWDTKAPVAGRRAARAFPCA